MRTAVLILSAAALVAPAMAIHEAVNDALPVGVTSNSVGVTERGTPDYGAAAPPPYAPESGGAPSASAAEPAATAAHKRDDTPAPATPDAPVPAPDLPVPELPAVGRRDDAPAPPPAPEAPVPAPEAPETPVSPPELPLPHLMRKRVDAPVPAPDAPVPAPEVPVPADVPPSHVVPSVTPPVATPAVPTPAEAVTTTTTTTSATASATNTAMKLARPATGNHAVKPVNHAAAKPATHHINVARDGLLDGFHSAIKTARSIVETRPAAVKREIISEIRRALDQLAAMGVTQAAAPQDDALAAKKQYTGSADGENVQLQGLKFDHETQPLADEEESVPAAEEEEEPTYSADV